jgi:dienelactone hydrolase
MFGNAGLDSIFGSESPKKDVFDDGTPGTGKYPAKRLTDATLDDHTIYAPITPPTDIKLPVLVFGNGGCANTGSSFTNLLTEIASHGYLVIANGAPASNPGGGLDFASILSGLFSGAKMKSSSIKQMTDAVDWVVKGSAAKYGSIDTDKIAASGQSCGGLQAYSASYHDDRIKQTILFNSGVIDDNKVYLLKELKYPVAYFIGGPKDIAYANVSFIPISCSSPSQWGPMNARLALYSDLMSPCRPNVTTPQVYHQIFQQ